RAIRAGPIRPARRACTYFNRDVREPCQATSTFGREESVSAASSTSAIQKPTFNGIMQIAYIVPDLKAAVDQYVKGMKVGPWFVSEHFAGQDMKYRGAPTSVDMAIAMSYSNQMCIELIQQLNDVPSVYTDARKRNGWGFHHWGVGTYD